MARFVLLGLCSALAATLPTAVVAQDRTCDEIIQTMLDEEAFGFQSGQVRMDLAIRDPSGDTRNRFLVVRGLREDGRSRALVRVVAPASQAGQAYLFLENATAEDDVYVFLPALDDAPRRIAGSQKNGSFMGSHFTFADLETRDLRDAECQRAEDETIGGFPVHVIDATPRAGTQSDYARIRLWIRHTDHIPLRIRFFDASGETRKTLFTEETDVSSSGRAYIRQMTLRMPDEAATTLRLEDVDFDAAVSAREFTPASLVQ
jgi:hypothetical protein